MLPKNKKQLYFQNYWDPEDKFVYIYYIYFYLFYIYVIHTYIQTDRHTYIHYIHTYTHGHTYTHRHTHTQTYTHRHTYIHTLIHYIHTLHTYIHTDIHTCMHTYIHTYMHAYIHTYIHTYIYMLLLLLLLVACVFFVVWPCTDWFVSLVNPDLWLTGPKCNLQQLALGTWSLDNFKLVYLSHTFSKVSKNLRSFRKHVVSDFWGIRAILKLLYRFFLSKKAHTDLDPTDLGLVFASLTSQHQTSSTAEQQNHATHMYGDICVYVRFFLWCDIKQQ